jgi:hypothetical protein
MRSITGTDPAAGVEISETVPAGVRWRLLSFRAVIVTDATVANRQPSLIVDDGTNTVHQSGANAAVAASAGAGYMWGAGVGAFGATGNGNQGSVPNPLMLAAGFRLRTSTLLFAGGDNWGAPQYLVEEWLEG